MDMNVSAANGIATLALNAGFYDISDLENKLEKVKEAFNIALDVSEIADQTIVDFSNAARLAKKALEDRNDVHARKVYELIGKFPAELGLQPVPNLEMAKYMVSGGGSEIIDIVRERGEFVAVWKNGEKVRRVEAYCLTKDKDSFSIEGVGGWNYADLRAFSFEDGFAFLLKDGTLFEAKED